MQLGNDKSKRSGANVFNPVRIGDFRTMGETYVASGWTLLRRRLTWDFVPQSSTAYRSGNIIERVCMKEAYVSGGNQGIEDSNVIVFEHNPVARLLLNRYSRLLGLGDWLL